MIPRLTKQISKILSIEFAFIAFLTVATQLQSRELMQMIVGQTLQGEVFVVATAFTGFLIGLSIRLNRDLKTFLYSLAALAEAVLFLFYEPIVEYALKSSIFGVDGSKTRERGRRKPGILYCSRTSAVAIRRSSP